MVVEEFPQVQGDGLLCGQSHRQVLERARALLVEPQRWTQYARARTAEGQPCRAESPLACAWCIEGAIARMSNPHGILAPAFMVLLDRLCLENYGIESVSLANEHLAHAELIRLLDLAIATLP